jgi:hypothetical protein
MIDGWGSVREEQLEVVIPFNSQKWRRLAYRVRFATVDYNPGRERNEPAGSRSHRSRIINREE